MSTEPVLNPAAVLAVLDGAAAALTFPVVDEHALFPAAARLTVFSDARQWSIVLETFESHPQAGLPGTRVLTVGSVIAHPQTADDFVDDEAFARHLRAHPNDHTHFVFPLEEDDWILEDDGGDDVGHVVPGRDVTLRGRRVKVPDVGGYRMAGVRLEDPPRVAVFEFARWLAYAHRDAVLATESERRAHVPEGLPEVLRLDQWRHPNIIEDEMPSRTETFWQLAEVAATGDAGHYRPTEAPNTHWSNWPAGGTL